MGAPTLRLADLTPINAKVLGVNGKPGGHCGYGLPVVRHAPTRLCCILSIKRKPEPVWVPEAEMREFEAAGRLTLFTDETPLPHGWTVESGRQPVVAWMPRFAWSGLPKKSVPQPLPFIKGEPDRVLICADMEDVEKLFSDLASKTQSLFDGLLASEPTDWQWLGELAEVGLHASRMPGPRYWMHVRRCVALYFRPGSPPEIAYQIFRVSVEPAYKGVTWARFLEGMTVVVERAKYARQEARAETNRLRANTIVEVRPEDLWRSWSANLPWEHKLDPQESGGEWTGLRGRVGQKEAIDEVLQLWQEFERSRRQRT